MKKNLFILLTAAIVGLSSANLFATDTNGIADGTNGIAGDTNGITAELNGIIARVIEKLQQGKTTESDLASNLEEYDALYARHKGEQSMAAAQILLAKVNLYMQVLHDPEKAVKVLKLIKQDFPGVQVNGSTDDTISSLENMVAIQKIRRTLVVGAPFPDFDEKDINGNPLSTANYKGKVVLVDFWATWCPPCRAELPNILATYKKYHEQGFEVIGISCDDDRQQLMKFLKENEMPWPEYNDGNSMNSKLALKYAVTLLPSNWLLDRQGIIIGQDLRGEKDLMQAVAKALGK